ncbi:MAG: GH3 auxin-responsive promoter family protein [Nanoarchaeota archaeon]
MLKKLYYFILNLLLVLSYVKHNLAFKSSLSKIEKVQKNTLLGILQNNKKSKFGIKHNFSSIKSIQDFQEFVPITTYDYYTSYIKLIENGNKNVLTREEVMILEPTSGSTAPSKLIPYTKSLMKEFQKGIGPWIYDMYTNRKQLMFGNAYWSITPMSKVWNSSKSKISIGFEDDAEYFGLPQMILLNSLFAVPRDVSKIEDTETFRYVTLLFLLKNKNLTFISIWSPTFLTLLFESFIEWSNFLIKDIENGTINSPKEIRPDLKKQLLRKLSRDKNRAKEIEQIINKWKNKKSKLNFLYQGIWPKLSLISCWIDSNSANYVQDLRIIFPRVEIQGKGLIATEGFVSFPITGKKGSVLSINSHFFEFIDVETGKIKLSHELNLNRIYSIIITTSGGLYRYKLQDLIKVVGFEMEAPLLLFLGKEDNISDLFGEKINQMHVSSIFKKLFKKYKISARFHMLAPCKNNPRDISYVIFIEPTQKIGKNLILKFYDAFETELKNNYHYFNCRKLDQLKMARLFLIRANGMQFFISECRKKGQKLGNIKPPVLNKDFGWENKFDGKFI